MLFASKSESRYFPHRCGSYYPPRTLPWPPQRRLVLPARYANPSLHQPAPKIKHQTCLPTIAGMRRRPDESFVLVVPPVRLVRNVLSVGQGTGRSSASVRDKCSKHRLERVRLLYPRVMAGLRDGAEFAMDELGRKRFYEMGGAWICRTVNEESGHLQAANLPAELRIRSAGIPVCRDQAVHFIARRILVEGREVVRPCGIVCIGLSSKCFESLQYPLSLLADALISQCTEVLELLSIRVTQ